MRLRPPPTSPPLAADPTLPSASRLEELSDAVFGFAITLLVVSLEVPRSYDDLLASLRGIPVFAVSFTLLLLVWHTHWQYFRRHPFADGTVVFLNSVLLFVVLCFIYPMKFLWVLLLGGFSGGVDTITDLTSPQAKTLLSIYSFGFVVIFGLFVALFQHAHRRKLAYGLTPRAAFDARASAQVCAVYAASGILALTLAWVLPAGLIWVAGMSYAILGPTQWALAELQDRARKRLSG